MLYYDVFNGDADGICALHQLRLAEPRDAQLVTGVKRDIRLLQQIVSVKAASITILDISLDSNRQELIELLKTCNVFYVDHHYAGDLPQSSRLEAHIDPRAEMCTSLIVDRLLEGAYRPWAVAAAFGDNLHESAAKTAETLALSAEQMAQLREIGELLNYNGYGKTVADLHFHPKDLYQAVHNFADPFDFYKNSQTLASLRDGFSEDMRKARQHDPIWQERAGRVFKFPQEPWARRVAGVFSNEKARERPDLAHALIVDNSDGTYLVSVRAPLANKQGADTLCRKFPTGGGRTGAAGINALPADQLDDFLHAFEEVFSS